MMNRTPTRPRSVARDCPVVIGRVVPRLLLVSLLLFSLLTLKSVANAQEGNGQDPRTINGGSLLAMAGRECVALAVDKRFGSGPQMVTVSPRHVWSPHPNLMLAFVGLEGDVQSLASHLKAEVSAKRDRALGFGTTDPIFLGGAGRRRRITPPALAQLTSHVLYRRRRYIVEPLVVGLMERTHRPFLCAMDMIGAQSFSSSFVCSGVASQSLYGTAEALWRPNMGPKDLAEVCGKAFQSALERDCLSGYGILVYLITKDGIVEFDLASRND
jgi:20S proteasome subunit beta 3